MRFARALEAWHADLVRLVVGAIFGLLFFGCGLSFPNEYLIEDLRPLEIRIEPPEIPLFRLAPGDSLELDLERPPPFDLKPITVTAVVAHPDLSATFRFDWTRCGITFLGPPCEEAPRERITNESGASFSFSPVEMLLSDAVDKGLSLTELAAGLVSDPRDLLNGFFLNIDVQVTVEEAGEPVDSLSIDATKRVVLFDPRIAGFTITETSMLDPSQLPEIPGLQLPELCTRASTEEVASLLEFLRQREPNQSPEVAGIIIGVRGRADTTTRTVVLGELVELEEGESLVMRSDLPEEIEESYRVIDGNCELQEFDEAVATSWFTNGGELSRQVSTLESPVVSWLPPLEVEKQRARYRIYAIVRDGRGGSDGTWFDVSYR
jgi:hypothetical protein